MNIIVTGFGSFLHNDQNPTKIVLEQLPQTIDNHTIYTIETPVVFDACFTPLQQAIDRYHPELIIMLGLAGGRTAITPERLAVNINDSRNPDNLGNTPQDEPIQKNGRNAYFSTLPLRAIEQALQQQNIPCNISNSAGLYVCNNLFYHTMYYLEQQNLSCKAGFIHVPYMDEQTKPKDAYSVPIETIVKSIINSIKQCI